MDPKLTEVSQLFDRFKAVMMWNDFDTCTKLLSQLKGASAGNMGNDKLVEQKKANPVALLLSLDMMLRHLQFPLFVDRLETAVERVILGGKYRTKDLGGHSTTREVVDTVTANLD